MGLQFASNHKHPGLLRHGIISDTFSKRIDLVPAKYHIQQDVWDTRGLATAHIALVPFMMTGQAMVISTLNVFPVMHRIPVVPVDKFSQNRSYISTKHDITLAALGRPEKHLASMDDIGLLWSTHPTLGTSSPLCIGLNVLRYLVA